MSTILNIGPPPMFSTRSPGEMPRNATTPSIGEMMVDLVRYVSAPDTWASAALVAAAAASRAERASSTFCAVARPVLELHDPLELAHGTLLVDLGLGQGRLRRGEPGGGLAAVEAGQQLPLVTVTHSVTSTSATFARPRT